MASLELTASGVTDHSYSGLYTTMTVTTNSVGFGAPLHLDTNGTWIAASASGTTTMPCSALAVETGTGIKRVLLQGFVRDDGWNWSTGGYIYSSLSGTLTQTAPSAAGNQVQVLGHAIQTTMMFFNPNYVLIEI
jgi:hypothetical protein